MATASDIEVIYLSSDDIQLSSPPPEAARRDTEDNPGEQAIPKDKGKGKAVARAVSLEQDVFPGRMVGGARWVDMTDFDFDGGEDKDAADPISSWGAQVTPRNAPRLIGEVEDVIVIDDSPVKPPPARSTTRQRLAIVEHIEFSATTTSILKDILGTKEDSGDELGDNVDISLGPHRFREPSKASRIKSLPKKRPSSGDIDNQDPSELAKAKRKKPTKGDSGLDNPPGSPGKRKGNKLLAEERERRVEEKARKATEKEAEREAKRLEKEAKALEKQKEQELATVNKLKTSKKDSVREMIVDISSSFAETPGGIQLRRFLETQECESTIDWAPSMPNVIKWRRKVTSKWDDDLGYFVPILQEIRDENHILVVLKAQEFVDMAMGSENLEDHVAKVKTLLGRDGAKPIYMIEGLVALLRKSRNAKNRSFQGAVLQAIGPSADEGSSGGSRTGKSRGGRDPRIIDEDLIEDALLRLQITHGCLIYHTAAIQETSEWISIFSGDISTIPYKVSRMNYDTSFCMDVGQVKTGNDPEDTYFKMLQEINRVTAGVANGIMGEYKSVRELMNACKTEGEDVVADLEIMANRDGVSSNRKIGQATSKRIHKLFMGLDPDSTDVDV